MKGLEYLESIKDQCPRGNYATGRRMSFSSIKGFSNEPYEYIEYVTAVAKDSNAFAWGNAYEEMVLGNPDKVLPWEKPHPEAKGNSKENKENKAAHADALFIGKAQDKIVIEDPDYSDVCDAVKAFERDNPVVCSEMRKGIQQRKVEGEISGIKWLGFQDSFFEQDGRCYEIKTINTMSDISRRILWSLKYKLQAGFYGHDPELKEWVWVFQSKLKPYPSVCIKLKKNDLHKWMIEVQGIMDDFSMALKYGFDFMQERSVKGKLGF